jgi:hypothetical protein
MGGWLTVIVFVVMIKEIANVRNFEQASFHVDNDGHCLGGGRDIAAVGRSR